MPPHADVRDCKLYRFKCWHPDDMHLPVAQRRILLKAYFGETGREPFARLLEHIRDQPWGDTMAGWDVIGEYSSKTAVLEAEREAIEREQPTYNVEWNGGNRYRIPPPQAIRQRRARDAANPHRPPWVHPDDRRGGRTAVRFETAPVAPKPWPAWQKHLVAWPIAWLATAIAGWITLVVKWDFVVWWEPLAGAASILPGLALVVLLVWALLRDEKPKKKRRRKVRR